MCVDLHVSVELTKGLEPSPPVYKTGEHPVWNVMKQVLTCENVTTRHHHSTP